MSGSKRSRHVPEQWTSETISRNVTLSITSAAAMFDALTEVGCEIHTDLPASKAMLQQQLNYEKALMQLSEIQPNSHDAANRYVDALEKASAASEALQDAKKLAYNESPSKIEFTDSSGVKRTMNMMSGAYMIEWSETKQTSNRGRTRINEDLMTRKFSDELKIANDKAQVRRSKNERQVMAQLKNRNSELASQMEQALRIRNRWEAIEEARRVESFRQERAQTLEKNAEKLGYNYKRLVDTKDEIILTMRK